MLLKLMNELSSIFPIELKIIKELINMIIKYI